MEIRDIRWVLAAGALLAPASHACAETVALECHMAGGGIHYFIIDLANETAQFVTAETTVVGMVHGDEHRYELSFPRSENRWEIRVHINRYSGTLAWEHGEPPFGQNSTNNVFRSGNCAKSDNRPKL